MEQRRARLARRLEEVLGREEAETLMAQLPPYDWPELATKHDLDELRTELKSDMEQLRTELKGEMGQLRAEVRGEISELRGEMGELRGEMSELRGQLRLEMAGHVRTHIIATVMAVAATGSLAFAAASLT